jgi:peptidyl-prolyl cis-trans isomerase D
MAILEQLRVRAGLLLAIVIGLALLAFVLSDLLDSGGSLFTRSKYEIAEISGKSVPYTDYEMRVRELEDMQKLQSGQVSLDEETMDQIRNVTWDNMIRDMLLEKQYSKLGLDVSQDELSSIIMGENPHPAIAQLFTDPQNGIFNRQAFNSFMQRIGSEEEQSEEKAYYLFLEKEIYNQRKNVKLINLIRKGLYATEFEAERQREESTKTVDLNFIVRNFTAVSDSAITVADKDIEKFYKENLKQFRQEESRDIRYISFEVVPSESDFRFAGQWINEVRPDFEKAEDMIQFVNMESDVPFDNINYNSGGLPDSIQGLFNASVGTTIGPYFIENSYRISRLAAVNYLPDSVKARHILLRGTAANAQVIFETADSLADLIKNGSDFGMLAMMNSSDQTAQSGGDLGWFGEGEMVKPFNDSCFYGKKGDVKIVPTQFGLHIIQIQDQSRPVKKVQVATLVKNVVASEETDHKFYQQANEFAGTYNTFEEFSKAVEEGIPGAQVERALNLGPLDKRVNDLESARQIVNWAYNAAEKDISTVFKVNERYIVAAVEKVREEGPAPLAEVRADIENRVKQQKKAELLASQFKEKSVATIEELARGMGLAVEPVSGLRFTSSSLGNAGIEPKVIAAATVLEKGVVSEPIIGENGVYVLSVNNINAPEENVNDDLSRNYVERNYAARTNYYAYEALKEMANIKDNRRMFY